ncbi:MAG: hypothetical protein ACHREM_32105 [Polyangiales bacterium]
MEWIFQLPIPNDILDVKAYVPALSERHARIKLGATCYEGAPIDAWPCLGARRKEDAHG